MSEKPRPLVSIVTPFYNTEAYLAECIESVLAQTYDNWEYVLVNNCSTDQSAKIAFKYAEKDERIRLIHNSQFLTQVQNYNHALRQIDGKSEYCKMVQADDMILPDCVSRMVSVAEEDGSIGVVSSYRLCGTTVRNVGLPYPETIYKGRDACRTHLIYGGNYFGTPTSILIRSDIIRNQDSFYREDIYFEDTVACFELLKNWNLGFVHQILSWEREDNESISSKIRNYDPHWLLAKFILITEFGKIYLNEDEYEEIDKDIKKNYFRYLARNFLKRKNNDFWSYHISGMRTVGYKFDYMQVVKYIAKELTKAVLTPVKDFKRLITGKL